MSDGENSVKRRSGDNFESGVPPAKKSNNSIVDSSNLCLVDIMEKLNRFQFELRLISIGEVSEYGKDGKMLTIYGIDYKKDTLKALVFDSDCDSITTKLEVNKIYRFMGVQFRGINTRFMRTGSVITHDIVLTSTTIIEELETPTEIIPTNTITFQDMSEVENMHHEDSLNLKGTVTKVGDIERRRSWDIRKVTITDGLNNHVNIVFWNKTARNLTLEVGDRISLLKVTINKFRGEININFQTGVSILSINASE